MLFDEERLNEALEQYRTDFPNWWKKGKDKWIAVETFQKHWDDEAEASDFPEMLRKALSEAKKIMVAWGGSDAKDAITYLAEKAPEETKALFDELFDENRDVLDRIREFKKKSATLCRQKLGSGQHLQGENTITTYLWLRYPDKYYIYRMNDLCALAAKIRYIYSFREGADSGHLNDEKRIREFYDLYDAICFRISRDGKLINTVEEYLADDACYKDKKHKTLTSDFAFYVRQKYYGNNSYDGYWWLVAKPDRWSLLELKIGGTQEYYSRTEKGKSQIYRNFSAVKIGDKVIGYEATPTLKVAAVCEIAEELKGDSIKIRKMDKVTRDIGYTTLTKIPELQNMEFLRSKTGSLFKLEEDEYNCLLKLIDGTYRPPEPYPDDDLGKYTAEDFLSEVFMSEDRYGDLVKILGKKQNIILNGVPGVGKTFAAERLAYSMMGEKDDSRIQLVQFHQNYSYEDFIEGYKPNEDGGFALEKGVFYKFCKKAAANKEKGKFFFIIDEINRGNISKIFGELMMTIEYREKKVVLAYSKEEFSIPDNLYIIGMMNTADRSIAMIDYALRRRFCHFELEPAFSTKEGMKKFKTWLKNNGSNKKALTKLITRIRKLNGDITRDLGKGFCIGHSYFCKENLNEEDLKLIVDYEIIPTLEQYWFDDPYKVITWTKILHGDVRISEAAEDNFEEKLKEELARKEQEALEELEAEDKEELEEPGAEDKEDNNAGRIAEK